MLVTKLKQDRFGSVQARLNKRHYLDVFFPSDGSPRFENTKKKEKKNLSSSELAEAFISKLLRVKHRKKLPLRAHPPETERLWATWKE